MKIIHEPTIYVLGRQTVVEDELSRFLGDLGVTWESDSEIPAEVLTEAAGRICYLSFAKPRPGGNAAYLHHIKESQHGSVCEHGVWTFLFTGISRSLTHELIRHRAGVSPSQLSQRYVDESVAEYIEPELIASDPECHQIWMDCIEYTHKKYVELSNKLLVKRYNQSYPQDGLTTLDEVKKALVRNTSSESTKIRKDSRQAARSVLPNATETKIVLTMNARAIRNILEQRGSQHAEPEIRQLAVKLLEVMHKESPNLFGDMRFNGVEIVTPFRKV